MRSRRSSWLGLVFFLSGWWLGVELRGGGMLCDQYVEPDLMADIGFRDQRTVIRLPVEVDVDSPVSMYSSYQ